MSLQDQQERFSKLTREQVAELEEERDRKLSATENPDIVNHMMRVGLGLRGLEGMLVDDVAKNDGASFESCKHHLPENKLERSL